MSEMFEFIAVDYLLTVLFINSSWMAFPLHLIVIRLFLLLGLADSLGAGFLKLIDMQHNRAFVATNPRNILFITFGKLVYGFGLTARPLSYSALKNVMNVLVVLQAETLLMSIELSVFICHTFSSSFQWRKTKVLFGKETLNLSGFGSDNKFPLLGKSSLSD